MLSRQFEGTGQKPLTDIKQNNMPAHYKTTGRWAEWTCGECSGYFLTPNEVGANHCPYCKEGVPQLNEEKIELKEVEATKPV